MMAKGGARRNSGQKIIPIEIKKARGTYRKDRDPGLPPASKEKPVAPAYLTPRQVEIFDLLTLRLSDTMGDSSTFTEVQALCAICLEEVEDCNNTITLEGKYYKTMDRHGVIVIKENPAMSRLEKSRKAAQSLLAEMALTRVTASKAGIKPKDQPKSNPFEDF